ncbi:upstream stimulatory factor 1 isoform X1 [Myotis lucifugus]|uniref:upstream stimulatory factor 1 isoform X1 n=2 Tax=Myotis lucifugus TaxID=59463 RepID=UPI000CCC44F5|nr:upstream stimulatory factor 1 isoform X1 [Myotis lucifugus]XP_023600351.1 upstream stimulatory factor 1 isoform X1 [Myotis lucifugus]XP_023600352.1 upstream stimulatory factor 1 isoform X1 [Myotis lucifugus]XP_023600353.1 upstream stimulatory factor 1 isoform X1 [Myotis lucifugus]XP_023600354.1 upstream stimulatory factor 1 isoform X1 [Myotis lucifugus]XP_023600355.1 upstream stimulatory factor 1 isoform X1 [Myotis lucifugus]XP_023600356.1 upstream stimulatory factor 1 isoform X1 [Myotis l
MKGQQKTAETEEGTVQIQEGAVATGEDPTSVAIASIQSSATFPDPNVKYVFRTENGGQVMYRVIQVSEGQLDGQTEGTGAISGYPATQSMTQAVIQGAFTSDDAVDTEGTAAETHYAYFPGTAVGDGAAGTTAGSAAAVVTTQGSEALLGQATPPGTGQFFVMMSPQEVLPGGSQRSIAPRTHPYSPVKGGFSPKPAITSRSCGRAITGCLRSCKGWTNCSWTTKCFASRWKTSRTRTCCSAPSCGTMGWRWSSRMTAADLGPCGGAAGSLEQQAPRAVPSLPISGTRLGGSEGVSGSSLQGVKHGRTLADSLVHTRCPCGCWTHPVGLPGAC